MFSEYKYQILDDDRPAFIGWTIFQIEYATTEITCYIFGHKFDEIPDQLQKLHDLIPEGEGDNHPAKVTFEQWTELRDQFDEFLKQQNKDQ